jgi:hypothetical protein
LIPALLHPHPCAFLRLHDLLKSAYRDARGGEEPGVAASLAAGVAAAFAGQLVAFPLETISRRLQVS